MAKVALLLAALLAAAAAPAMDRVVARIDGRDVEIVGRVMVEAEDGGLMVLARDGVIWTVQPEQRVSRTSDPAPFAPLSVEALSARLLSELPKGFDVHRTAHYLICYNTSREYAQWCGSLFEQLYRGFGAYWGRKGFHLEEPEFPLVAVVFNDRKSYMSHAQAEVGDAAESIIGYFSLKTNRMTMYDLTGVESIARGKQRRGTLAEISQVLAQPEAERTVSTIVHEATHQIAFNCGLHVRFSDCPLWYSEGIAVFFETPDLASMKGWKNVGAVNRSRLAQFRQYLRKRPADSLKTLISDDSRLRNPQQALDAYAEAWALTYFLIRQRSSQYIDYMKMLSAKQPLMWDTPAQRIKEFEAAFGDLQKLDAEFLRAMAKVQ